MSLLNEDLKFAIEEKIRETIHHYITLPKIFPKFHVIWRNCIEETAVSETMCTLVVEKPQNEMAGCTLVFLITFDFVVTNKHWKLSLHHNHNERFGLS